MIRRPQIAALRALVSLGLLATLALFLDPSAILNHIGDLEPIWLTAALALGTLQIALSAERWRRTAVRLDVPLGKGRALADYYIAGFTNQVLPGGIIGDAGRAWRHSNTSGRPGPAVRAVILERASGQFVLVLVLLATLVATEPGALLLARLDSPAGPGWATPMTIAIMGVLTIAIMIVGVLTVGLAFIARGGQMPSWLKSLARDARFALLARDAWPAQLALSLAVVATYCATFACAGRMIGVDVPAATLFVIAPVVLLAMLLPISVAGWGVRETAAAGVWIALGWPATEGVAVSVAYGALCLLANLPGAFVPALMPIRQAWRPS